MTHDLYTLRNRGSAAEADAIGGALGSGHMRLVLARDTTTQRLFVHQSRGLRAVCQTHADIVKEARPQKHTYICNEERIVVCHAVLTRMEVRAAEGCLVAKWLKRWTADPKVI